MAILICSRFNGFRNFKRYYPFCAREYMGDLSPQQLPYDRFIELESRVIIEIMLFLQVCCLGRCTGISFVDSTSIPVCHNRRIRRNRVFKEYTSVGKNAMRWYFGFKLYLTCNERGELVNFIFIKTNMDDRGERVFNRLSDDFFGKLFADRGYISQRLFERLCNDDINLVTGLRSSVKNKLIPLYNEILLKKRSAIETISNELRNVAQLVHSRRRGVFSSAISALSVLAACCLLGKKPAINVNFYIDRQGQQLTLF